MATLKSIKNKYLSTADGATLGVDQNKDNVSLLAFKMAAADSIAKFDMRDGFFDDYQDASGVDASGSTNESRSDSNYYRGAVSGSYSTDPFTTTGSDTWTCPADTVQAEIVVVGGGGGGAAGCSYGANGGGGGGGIVHATAYPVTAGTVYDLTIGSGGGSNSSGSNSVFNVNGEGSETAVLTANGGGGGGTNGGAGQAGGSGGAGGGCGSSFSGGSSNQTTSFAASSTATGYGGPGESGYYTGNSGARGHGGGGGGAGDQSTTWTRTGHIGKEFSNFTGYGHSNLGRFGGGGGGAAESGNGGGQYGGGNGGALNQNGTSGVANTGGGGGGARTMGGGSGGSGGSGVVLIRHASLTSADLTLVSNSTTADSTPTTGDIVMTYTNGAGTATINTDLKAYISRDGGTTWTQGTLVSEGTTGSDTILAARRVDISGQPSGTSMRYKVTTHNQSVAKETRIQAASLAWA